MKILILISLVAGFSIANEGKPFISDVFDEKGQVKKFFCERDQKRENQKIVDNNVCKDLNGEVLVVEKMERRGSHLVRYDIEQKQIKQKAWIELKDGKVVFGLKEDNKELQRKTIDKPKNFIIGMQIVPFIVEHWDAFTKGERKKVELALWSEQKILSFYLSREKMDEKIMLVKMRPSGLLARMALGSFYFTISVNDKKVLEYKGRTNLKEKRGDDYRDFKALVRYSPS